MNKSQFIEALSVHFEGNRRKAAHAVESVIDTVQRELTKKGGQVRLTGFGSFQAVDKAARMVRNPRTGETKAARKTTVPKFRPGANLKSIVKGEKKLPKLTVAKAAAPSKSSASKSTAKKAAKKSPAKKTASKSTAKKTARKSAKMTAKKTARKR